MISSGSIVLPLFSLQLLTKITVKADKVVAILLYCPSLQASIQVLTKIINRADKVVIVQSKKCNALLSFKKESRQRKFYARAEEMDYLKQRYTPVNSFSSKKRQTKFYERAEEMDY